MTEKTFEGFWAELLRLKDTEPYRGWTIRLQTDIAGTPRHIVEHEFNHRLPAHEFEAAVARVLESHWPGERPAGVVVRHCVDRALDASTGGFVSRTTMTGEAGLPGRSNVILIGVPDGAFEALKTLGGKHPEKHEILRH